MEPNQPLRVKYLDFKLASPQEIQEELGRRLRTQRLSKNWKQQELADRAGVSPGTIKNLEREGQSSIETLVRVCVALDLTGELASLFEPKISSIAQMERLEKFGKLRRRAR